MLKWVIVVCALLIAFGNANADPGSGFIENKNQWPCEVDFLADVAGGQMAISAGQFNYFFLDYKKLDDLHHSQHLGLHESDLSPDVNGNVKGRKVSVRFIGSNSSAVPTSSKKSNTYYNYFLGSDPAKWASGAYSFSEVNYNNLYDGVDMRLAVVGANVKYDLIVQPGADPSSILIDYQGARSIALSEGDLIVDGEFTEIVEKKPVAYQWIDGVRRYVKVEYVFVDNYLTFSFPDGFDQCYELTIDPLLIFSTYSGSQADNWGSTATPGENGSLYSSGVTNHFVGQTFSGTFLATSGAFQTNYGGIYDVAILKYDSAGHNLLYASYLGGSQSESPHSLVVDKDQNLLVLGTTSSGNFPTTAGAFDRNFDAGGGSITNVVNYANGSDIFVTKVSKDGSQLLGSTFLGGSQYDGLGLSNSKLVQNYGDQLRGDIITDQDGNVFISSVTASPNFPAVNSFSTTFKGGDVDAVVVKLDGQLSQILWSAFVGGSGNDAAYSIKFDSEGKLWLAGGTTSSNFPVAGTPFNATINGDVDGWILNLEPDGTGIIAGTFTGTTAYDQIYFVDLNTSDEVYVYGQTAGPMPVTSGVYSNSNSGQFLQKFSHDLSTRIFSTVFGSGRGTPDISPTAFLVNECNNIYMTGWGGTVNINANKPLLIQSSTNGLPITADAYQNTTSGSDFYFIVLTDDASQFLYGTYMGGNQSKTHVDGGTSRFDKGGIVYHAVCSGCLVSNSSGQSTSDFPTTPNAWSNTNFSLNCNNAAFKFDLSSLNARIVTNSIDLDQPGLTRLCLPDKIVFQNRSTGGEFYEWDFGDGTVDSKTDTAAIIHEYAGVGTYLVRLKAVDQGTCIGEDIDFATIVVSKATGFAGEGATICEGDEIKLVAGGGVSYEWKTLKDGVVSEIAQPSFSPADSTRYFVSVLDANSCLFKDTLSVDVIPRIDLKFDYEKVTDCDSRAALKISNMTEDSDEQFFEFGDGNSSNQRDITHQFDRDGVYTVRLVGRREFCVFEEIVSLPFITIRVPNVITPENSVQGSSGKNDTFKIRYGESQDSPTTTEAGILASLAVYNRWGKLVFQSDDYRDEWAGDGLEAGSYYYEVEIQNEPACKGWVQIIR